VQYLHELTGETLDGHPIAEKMGQVVRGLKKRAHERSKPQEADHWLQFSDEEGDIYFYSMRTGVKSHDFPMGKLLGQGAIVSCVLPFRSLEPSAQRLCDAAASCWPDLHGAELEARAEAELWAPVKSARAAALAHEPCQLTELINFGNYIGLDAALYPELMWLVNVALTPELPVGWLHRSLPDGSAYYWNAILGLAQWEHPAVSYCCGIAKRICRAKAPMSGRERLGGRRGQRGQAIEAARTRDEKIGDAIDSRHAARGII